MGVNFGRAAIWLQVLVLGFAAVAQAAAVSAVTCPASNSTHYITNNSDFLVQCGIDHSSGDLSWDYRDTFSLCIDSCAALNNCVAVSYSGAACYRKSSLGNAVYNGVKGAVLIARNVSATTSASSSVATTSAVFTNTTSVISSTAVPTVVVANTTTLTSIASNTSIAVPTAAFTNTTIPVLVNATATASANSSIATSAPFVNATTSALVLANATATANSSIATSAPFVNATTSVLLANATATANSSIATSAPFVNATSSVPIFVNATATANSSIATSAPFVNATTSLPVFVNATATANSSIATSAPFVNATTSVLLANATATANSSIATSAPFVNATTSVLLANATATANSSIATSAPFVNATTSVLLANATATANSSIATSAPFVNATTTTASAVPTQTPVTCPASNGTTYTYAGYTYQVQCGIDHSGGDFSMVYTSSLSLCIEACAVNEECVALAWTGSNACYMKNSIGSAVNDGVAGAVLIASPSTSTSSSSSSSSASSSSSSSSSSSVATTVIASATATPTAISCPASNGTVYTSSGISYTIECGIDHAGGDLGSVQYYSTFAGCIDACAASGSCLAVAYSDNACYLKGSVGAAVYDGVWGAVIAPTAPTSTAVVASSPASSTVAATTSSSSTLVSTSTPTPTTAASALTCPDSNGTEYISNGEIYQVMCGVDHSGGDLDMVYTSSFSACVDTCAGRSDCLAVAYTGSHACYMKSTIGPAVNDGVYGAVFVSMVPTTTSSASPSYPTATLPLKCPSGNQTLYTVESTGDKYLIECGVDHAAGDLAAPNGIQVSSLEQCIALCDAREGCVDVSLSGVACYLKGSVGANVYQFTDVLGGRLISTGSSTPLRTVRRRSRFSI